MAEARGIDGADGRGQRLAQHLAAEHALGAGVGTEAPKNILLDLLQIEQTQHFRQSFLTAFTHGVKQSRFDAFANPSCK